MKIATRALSVLAVFALALAALPTTTAYALDATGPSTSGVAAAPNPANVGDPVVVTATVDDTLTGGSAIIAAQFSTDGGATWTAMSAVDGSWDNQVEAVTGNFIASVAGTYDVCVQGKDDAGNWGDPACVSFTANDGLGPIASNVVAVPNPAVQGDSVTVTATVDDSTTGNSNIQSAEFSLDGGTTWTPMTADDAAFDSPTENVTGTFTATDMGDFQLCVRGTDALNNVGTPTCIDFASKSIYTFSGFRPPVRDGMRAKAGRTLPLKFKLTMTADGTFVSDPSVIVGVFSYQVDCTSLTGDSSTATLEKSPGKAGLRYQGNGRWRFLWKTLKSYKDTCRMLYVEFSDGSTSPEYLIRFH